MNYLGLAIIAGGMMSVSSCKKKQNTEDIIIEKVVDKPQSSAKSCKKVTNKGDFSWIDGRNYSYLVNVAPDASLPEVENHEETYKDNSIDLTITRSDGSEFFSSKFTKNSFTSLLSDDMKQNGVLLNMKYEKSDANNAYFLVTVGSPDEMLDDFVVIRLIVTRFAETKLAEYNPS